MQQAYSLLRNKGLIRIGLPMQPAMQFKVQMAQDSYGGCNTNPATGLTGATSGFLSFYRRPLPSTNLNFLSAIMWDGREPDLFHQSVDATLGHAEGSHAPAAPLQQQIVSFEGCTTALTPELCASIAPGEGLVTAQVTDNDAGDLTEKDATGGPLTLAQQIGGYDLCINDPFGCGGQPFNPVIFTVYDAWANLTGSDPQTQARQKIARGQQVFNSVTFKITGVAGLNDVQGQATINGPCGHLPQHAKCRQSLDQHPDEHRRHQC
jgi:cytochrome c peroxidase